MSGARREPGQAFILELRDSYEQLWLEVLEEAGGRLLPADPSSCVAHSRGAELTHLVPSRGGHFPDPVGRRSIVTGYQRNLR